MWFFSLNNGTRLSVETEFGSAHHFTAIRPFGKVSSDDRPAHHLVYIFFLDVLIAQTNDAGERTADMDATQPVALTEQGRTEVQHKGLRLIRTVVMRPGATDIRVVVRDTATGAVGSVVIPATALRRER